MNLHSSPVKLILSAWEPEQRHLNLKNFPSNVKSGFTGIGLVEAALHTTRYVSNLHPAEIIFIGTAGAYPGRFLNPGDVLVASDIKYGDLSLATNQSYLPEKQHQHFSYPKFCNLPQLPYKVRNGSVLSVPAITKTDESAIQLRDYYKADAEQLEVFAVARIADYFRISFTAVLGISNLVGPNSHADWKAYEDLAVEHASRVVEDWLIMEPLPNQPMQERQENQ